MAQPPESSATLQVRVQPRSSRNQVLGFRGDTLRVQVTAPPEAGKANAAVIALLADTLGLPKRRVRIIRGHASRDKLVLFESLGRAELQRQLSAAGE